MKPKFEPFLAMEHLLADFNGEVAISYNNKKVQFKIVSDRFVGLDKKGRNKIVLDSLKANADKTNYKTGMKIGITCLTEKENL
jgi:hypothetical protein